MGEIADVLNEKIAKLNDIGDPDELGTAWAYAECLLMVQPLEAQIATLTAERDEARAGAIIGREPLNPLLLERARQYDEKHGGDHRNYWVKGILAYAAEEGGKP